mmetsp:Transcript_15136/g.35658  ORF Transcript_15136/g.35658 Transcript_15136/m.35658 type:complete len:261 (+) Transcript_15136:1867-2649(+)
MRIERTVNFGVAIGKVVSLANLLGEADRFIQRHELSLFLEFVVGCGEQQEHGQVALSRGWQEVLHHSEACVCNLANQRLHPVSVCFVVARDVQRDAPGPVLRLVLHVLSVLAIAKEKTCQSDALVLVTVTVVLFGLVHHPRESRPSLQLHKLVLLWNDVITAVTHALWIVPHLKLRGKHPLFAAALFAKNQTAAPTVVLAAKDVERLAAAIAVQHKIVLLPFRGGPLHTNHHRGLTLGVSWHVCGQLKPWSLIDLLVIVC